MGFSKSWRVGLRFGLALCSDILFWFFVLIVISDNIFLILAGFGMPGPGGFCFRKNVGDKGRLYSRFWDGNIRPRLYFMLDSILNPCCGKGE